MSKIKPILSSFSAIYDHQNPLGNFKIPSLSLVSKTTHLTTQALSYEFPNLSLMLQLE